MIPTPALSAWRIWTEPELQDAIQAGWNGRSTPEQSLLLSAWVWARVTDYRWRTLTDLIDAYREALAEVESDDAA